MIRQPKYLMLFCGQASRSACFVRTSAFSSHRECCTISFVASCHSHLSFGCSVCPFSHKRLPTTFVVSDVSFSRSPTSALSLRSCTANVSVGLAWRWERFGSTFAVFEIAPELRTTDSSACFCRISLFCFPAPFRISKRSFGVKNITASSFHEGTVFTSWRKFSVVNGSA